MMRNIFYGIVGLLGACATPSLPASNLPQSVPGIDIAEGYYQNGEHYRKAGFTVDLRKHLVMYDAGMDGTVDALCIERTRYEPVVRKVVKGSATCVDRKTIQELLGVFSTQYFWGLVATPLYRKALENPTPEDIGQAQEIAVILEALSEVVLRKALKEETKRVNPFLL